MIDYQTYNEGLVDCSSVNEFNDRLSKCESVWNAREASYAPPGGSKFFLIILALKKLIY